MLKRPLAAFRMRSFIDYIPKDYGREKFFYMHPEMRFFVPTCAIITALSLFGCDKLKHDVTIIACSPEERSLWKDNLEFSRVYHECSASAWGSPGPISECLRDGFEGFSLGCGACLGNASLCAAKNCMKVCFFNPGSDDCRVCFERNCNAGLLACTGASSASELPRPHVPSKTNTKAGARLRVRAPTSSVEGGS